MRLARRVIIAVVGGTVLLIGVVMIVLPAPSILVIPLGLAILAVEFTWARVWLQRVRRFFPRKAGRKPKQPEKDPNGRS